MESKIWIACKINNILRLFCRLYIVFVDEWLNESSNSSAEYKRLMDLFFQMLIRTSFFLVWKFVHMVNWFGLFCLILQQFQNDLFQWILADWIIFNLINLLGFFHFTENIRPFYVLNWNQIRNNTLIFVPIKKYCVSIEFTIQWIWIWLIIFTWKSLRQTC